MKDSSSREGVKVPSFEGRDLGIGEDQKFMTTSCLCMKIIMYASICFHLLSKQEGLGMGFIKPYIF
jgi:hypothetical protein